MHAYEKANDQTTIHLPEKVISCYSIKSLVRTSISLTFTYLFLISKSRWSLKAYNVLQLIHFHTAVRYQYYMCLLAFHEYKKASHDYKHPFWLLILKIAMLLDNPDFTVF